MGSGRMRAVPPGLARDPAAELIWIEAMRELQQYTPASAWGHWTPSIRFVGTYQGALCCAGPQEAAEWLRSKLGPYLGGYAREHGYAGLRVYESPRPDNDLL